MTAEKQGKAYGALMAVAAVLLLGAQYGLQYMFKQSSEELISVQSSLASETGTLKSQQSLSARYDAFKEMTKGLSGADRQFPVSGRELYTAISVVLNDYNVEFENSSPTAGNQPGAEFTLTIKLKGKYYDIIKAMAAIRESGYIMRMSQLSISANGDGIVSGTMNIVSQAQKS